MDPPPEKLVDPQSEAYFAKFRGKDYEVGFVRKKYISIYILLRKELITSDKFFFGRDGSRLSDKSC